MEIKDIIALKGKELEDAIDALIAEKDNLQKEVATLSKKLSAAEKAGFVKLTVEIGKGKDKKEYEVLSGAKVGATKFSAEELAKNEEACKEILKKEGQGILKEVTE